MNHMKKSLVLSLVLSTSVYAAPKKSIDTFYTTYKLPAIQEANFDEPEYLKIKKEWTKQNRKVASAMSFNEADMSSDMHSLREAWLKVKTGNGMEAILHESKNKYNSYSTDTKYFLTQMHLSLPLRGVVWRMRKLFENNKKFMGNKSTHVMAIQAVRGAAIGLKNFLPTNQSDAEIEFFTEPSLTMTSADQFKSMAEFQTFLYNEVSPAIDQAAAQIIALKKQAPNDNFVWDNKIGFGTATFEDEMSRYVGNGPAEVNFVLSSLYKAQHDLLVYCAYNQDHAIKVAGEIGSHVGIDSGMFSGRNADLGITDKERMGILRNAVAQHHFLELRNYGDSKFGSETMKKAYVALKNSVVYSERSYDYLQSKEATSAMAINPILFQPQVGQNLDKGLKNMKAVVSGVAEVRDPVTGGTVTLNLPAFYNNPPKSLGSLMAVGFETGELEKVITNQKGEQLHVRNYLRGRAISWDNGAWKNYVPSAQGQGAKYMSEANRIINYSFGTSMVFGISGFFIQ